MYAVKERIREDIGDLLATYQKQTLGKKIIDENVVKKEIKSLLNEYIAVRDEVMLVAEVGTKQKETSYQLIHNLFKNSMFGKTRDIISHFLFILARNKSVLYYSQSCDSSFRLANSLQC